MYFYQLTFPRSKHVSALLCIHSLKPCSFSSRSPPFLLRSFHQKSFSLTVLVFISLSLSYTRTHTHTHTHMHAHLSFNQFSYCMSLRQTVSLIGLFVSSPVWCTETHKHSWTDTHTLSMHTHAFWCVEMFLYKLLLKKEKCSHACVLFRPIRECRACVWLDSLLS